MSGRHTSAAALYMTPHVFQHMEDHTLHCLPNEACGLLLGQRSDKGWITDTFIPVPNVSRKPKHQFILEPVMWTTMLLQHSKEIAALFHSHPAGPPVPSRDDVQQLQDFGSLFPFYLIASPKGGHMPGIVLHSYTPAPLSEGEAEGPVLNRKSAPHASIWTLQPADCQLLK